MLHCPLLLMVVYIMNERKEYGNVIIAMEKDRTRSV